MSYLVLARKFRPQNFDEVIGQEHITTTLKNAIEQNRVAHAYLFTGPRGIGKTSTARILAKALNCQKGPTPTPCNKCTSCEEIIKGSSLDVIEIDGASNRGIEEVRNLRENVKFAPSHGRFKVYIIDEVHMLTQEAFNALLKTLEEPPAHVKFVFATTASHKVPSTVLSRCQRFDFKRIPIKSIVNKLADIASQEKFTASQDALFAIAKASEGSMRDAQSLLDQLASFCDRKIKLEDVSSLLGTVEQDILFDAAQLMVTKDAKGALELVDKILNQGKDLILFVQGLIEHFRNLLVFNLSGENTDLLDLPEDSIERIAKQSRNFTTEDLIYILSVLAAVQDNMKTSPLARIPLEVGLVKLAMRENLVSLAEILDRLQNMDKNCPQEIQAVQDPIDPADSAPVDPADPEPLDTATIYPAQESDILNAAKQKWEQIIDKVKQEKISCGTYLEVGQPISAEGKKLVIGFHKHSKFNYESIQGKDNHRIIEKIARSLLGDVTVGFVITDSISQPVEPIIIEDNHKDETPIVKSALDMFKGGITKVE